MLCWSDTGVLVPTMPAPLFDCATHVNSHSDTPPQQPSPAKRGQSNRPRGGAQPGAAQHRGGAARARPIHPALEKLAELHPRLFGAQFLPLKLGTYQDLMEAHPGLFEAADLKEALGQHTRSTRYLANVARGMQRHDLHGEPVGDLARDHVHHAVVELFRRRQARSPEDVQPALRQELRNLFIASGLGRGDYAAAAKVNAEMFSLLLDQADFDQADAIARREALMRAFEASGMAVTAFADMYGMATATVEETLARATDDRRVKASREVEAVPALPVPAEGTVPAISSEE